MIWEPEHVIGQLRSLLSKLKDKTLAMEAIEASVLMDEIVHWVDAYRTLDQRFDPYARQFAAAAGPICAAARQLELGSRDRTTRYVESALERLKPRDWFDC